MDTWNKARSWAAENLRRIGIFLATIGIVAGLSTTPASASEWYTCYLTWGTQGNWDWCYDDPYWHGVYHDQYGNTYEIQWGGYTGDWVYLEQNNSWAPMTWMLSN